jgi:hypothetical protein
VTIVRRRQVEVFESTKTTLPRLGVTSRRESDVTRAELKRYDEIFPRLRDAEVLLDGVRSQLDAVARNVRGLAEAKADKADLQGLFVQFRNALGELSGRFGALRKSVMAKADAEELAEMQHQLAQRVQDANETAASAEGLRCLLCGKPQAAVRGAIDDAEVAKALGQGTSARVASVDAQGNRCFVYGDRGALFWGRTPDGKPLMSKGREPTTPLPPVPHPSVRKAVDSTL